jgi:uncharacterized protein YbaP (TraB family)
VTPLRGRPAAGLADGMRSGRDRCRTACGVNRGIVAHMPIASTSGRASSVCCARSTGTQGRRLRRWLSAGALALLSLLALPVHAAQPAGGPPGPVAPMASAEPTDCPPVARPPGTDPAAAGQRGGARDRGFLWRLSRDGRSSYLYGTIHVGKHDWTEPGPRVRQALLGTQSLALELDLTDPAMLQQIARSVSAATDPEAGRPALPASARQRLARQAALACVASEAFARQHPVMQAITLTVLSARRDGLDPAYAQELSLAALARGQGKPIVSLESAETQATLLVPSDPGQSLLLTEETLSQLERGQARAMLVRIARVWEDGDFDQLDRFESWCGCADTEAERRFLRQLNDDRNGPMAERIDALHGSGRTVFAAVGALHMTGPQGLPRLLARRGYRVDRVPLGLPP